MTDFYIQQATLTEIEAAARRGFPKEICGFIGGAQYGQGSQLMAAINVARNALVEYNVAPEATLAALIGFEMQGLKLSGVYHSHPNYPAKPSGTDLKLADLPHACYLITSVYPGDGGELNCQTTAWYIAGQRAEPAQLIILD